MFSLVGLRHCYITNQLPLERIFGSFVPPYQLGSKILHSFIKQPKESLFCANSVIEAGLDLSNDKELVVISSTVHGKNLELAGRACLINTVLPLDEVTIVILRVRFQAMYTLLLNLRFPNCAWSTTVA